MSERGRVLYIGGFELPDKNAAAQRVIGIAKSLRDAGFEVRFINALKEFAGEPHNTEYFGFDTFEYKREGDKDYLFDAKKAISLIRDEKPNVVIAYNYPAVALDKIRKYCKKTEVKCIADATEWYRPSGNVLYRAIKTLDTEYRMRIVHKRLDGVIAISRFLYDYYYQTTETIMIPPTVDKGEEKWKQQEINIDDGKIRFVYAGTPSATKENLPSIVRKFGQMASKEDVLLNIVGINLEEYRRIYNQQEPISDKIIFLGRLSHEKVIQILKESNWAVVIRDNNLVVKAGFPTKVAESISAGIPVIANRFSNIDDYLDQNNSILIDDISELSAALQRACSRDLNVDTDIFDYHKYIQTMDRFIKKVLNGERNEN